MARQNNEDPAVSHSHRKVASIEIVVNPQLGADRVFHKNRPST